MEQQIPAYYQRRLGISNKGQGGWAVEDFEEAMKIIPEGRQKVRDDLQDDIVKIKKMIC